MEPILMIVMVLMFMILGIIAFNYNSNVSMPTLAGFIFVTAAVSFLLIMIFYNSHPECDAIINHNNQTLQLLQDKCYQYIDF